MERRSGGNVVDIYASILRPNRDVAGGTYLVIVSAFPTEPGRSLAAYPYRTSVAESREEAMRLREKLARELRGELECWGYVVRTTE
jgi:hypothetical protein